MYPYCPSRCERLIAPDASVCYILLCMKHVMSGLEVSWVRRYAIIMLLFSRRCRIPRIQNDILSSRLYGLHERFSASWRLHGGQAFHCIFCLKFTEKRYKMSLHGFRLLMESSRRHLLTPALYPMYSSALMVVLKSCSGASSLSFKLSHNIRSRYTNQDLQHYQDST